MNDNKKALAAALGSVFAASFSAIFIRVAVQSGTDPVILAFWRLFLSCLLLVPYTMRQALYRQELFRLSKSQISLMILSGLLLSLHFSSWFVSLKYTATVSSTLLVCTEPAFVLIGAFLLFGERPCRKALPGLLAAAAGIILVALPIGSGAAAVGSGETALWGNLLALFGAVSVSGYILAGRALMGGISTLLYSACVYTVCLAGLGLLAFLLGHSVLRINLTGLLMAAGLALVCQLLGHTVCNWALKFTKAANVSSVYLLEPVLTAIWVVLIWKEVPGLPVILGGTLLLSGILYFIRCESEACD
jgi:drug/metabolite transporter (DMT)-like permease